jgi:hypothetical protein
MPAAYKPLPQRGQGGDAHMDGERLARPGKGGDAEIEPAVPRMAGGEGHGAGMVAVGQRYAGRV